MSERIAIGKKLRFEVFKRDNFTCQYCGGKAPEIVLHVDHINPVSKGGENDILNLITSCVACNLGNGDRRLTDNTELEKQRAQLEELSERRQQIEWMMEWRNELSSLNDDIVAKASAYFSERVDGYALNDGGLRKMATWVKKYEFALILESIEAATAQYVKCDESGVLRDSVNKAFDMIPRIAAAKASEANKPWMKDVYYIRAILRNRLPYLNEGHAVRIIEDALTIGMLDTEVVKNYAKRVSSWSQFRDGIQEAIDDLNEDRP